jgi:AcrR family transcriptional regulator
MATKLDAPDKRRAPLSRERILKAALRIADDEGLEALSMRRLAADLDATPMALYNHVPNKDALLLSLSEVLLTEIDLSVLPTDDPERAIKLGYGEYRKLLLRHPNLMPCVQMKGEISPDAMRPVELALSLLRDLGFSPEEAMSAHWALVGLTMGHVVWQLSNPLFEEDGMAAHVMEHRRTLPASEFPCIHAALPELEEWDMDAAFDFGIDALIQGFKAMIAAKASAAHS